MSFREAYCCQLHDLSRVYPFSQKKGLVSYTASLPFRYLHHCLIKADFSYKRVPLSVDAGIPLIGESTMYPITIPYGKMARVFSHGVL